MGTVKLETPLAVYDKLCGLTDGRGKTAKVDKRELQRLLVDHSRMTKRLGIQGYDVEGN
jgi:hypothetical protein